MKFVDKNAFVELLDTLKIEYFHCPNPYLEAQGREYLTINVENVGDFVSDILLAMRDVKIYDFAETLDSAQEAFDSMIIHPNEGGNLYTLTFTALEYKEGQGK